MTYRDMTFCAAWDSCAKGATCFRALTPEVHRLAKKDGAPVSVCEKFDCYKTSVFFCTHVGHNVTEEGCEKCKKNGDRVRKEFFKKGVSRVLTREECRNKHEKEAIVER